jgi:DNA-binding transcriptional MerR regulator
MLIGALAKKTNVPIQTIRFYELRKLLRQPPRTASGYRSYTEADVERLGFIKQCQHIGFTLKDIRELLSIHDAAQTVFAPSNPAPGHTSPGQKMAGPWKRAVRIAEERLRIVDEKIAELAKLRAQLEGIMQAARQRNFALCQHLCISPKLTGRTGHPLREPPSKIGLDPIPSYSLQASCGGRGF